MNFLFSPPSHRLLFALDPEKAHGASIAALKAGLHPRFDGSSNKALQVQLAGLTFPNPLGMAAGYDKNADVPDALLAMGFGHTEIGTVTPLSQPGNPKPRIFRLTDDRAVINRLGFNSQGHTDVLERVKARQGNVGIVGLNIGANKQSTDFTDDYVRGIHAFADYATYFTINISSPNTPGLRALQGANPLADLLARASDARQQAQSRTDRKLPVFLKIAPDLDDKELDTIAQAVLASDIDALIVSNTTLSRAGLESNFKDEVGGLSGAPLFTPSTIILAKMFKRLERKIPLIGVGGIRSSEDAFAKMEAGASLVQLYTGMIYEGPNLPRNIVEGLSHKLRAEKLHSISAVVGRRADEWAERDLII